MNLKLVLAGGVMLAAFSLPAFADNKVCDFSMGGTSTASATTPGATATNAAGLTQNRNHDNTSAANGVNTNGIATANNENNRNRETSTNASASNTGGAYANGNNDYAYNDNGHPRWTAEFNGAGTELGSIEASIVKDCNTGDIMYLQLPAANAAETASRAAADLCNFDKQVWLNADNEGGYLLCQFQGRRKLATQENK